MSCQTGTAGSQDGGSAWQTVSRQLPQRQYAVCGNEVLLVQVGAVVTLPGVELLAVVVLRGAWCRG